MLILYADIRETNALGLLLVVLLLLPSNSSTQFNSSLCLTDIALKRLTTHDEWLEDIYGANIAVKTGYLK